MKTILVFLSVLFMPACFMAQTGVKTITLSVKGNCDECKERIENAADIKGVKLCRWNEVTQAVTVTYNPEKVSPEQIEKAIAASGHDAGKSTASKAGYSKLPECCKYRDKKCEQKK